MVLITRLRDINQCSELFNRPSYISNIVVTELNSITKVVKVTLFPTKVYLYLFYSAFLNIVTIRYLDNKYLMKISHLFYK